MSWLLPCRQKVPSLIIWSEFSQKPCKLWVVCGLFENASSPQNFPLDELLLLHKVINHHWICVVSPKGCQDQANVYVLSSWNQELDWSPGKLVDIDSEILLSLGKVKASRKSSWASSSDDIFFAVLVPSRVQGLSGVLKHIIHCPALAGSSILSTASPSKMLGELPLPCWQIQADCRVKCS